MSTTSYRSYLKEVFALAQTLVIKLNSVVDSMNMDVENRLLPFSLNNPYYARNQPNNPELWKYYKNLNGEYHQLDNQLIRAINISLGYPEPTIQNSYTLDEMLVYVASDNGPVLANFNKALINNNTTTANEYRYGTSYYLDLCARYPEHEHLMLGILNPISPNIAIGAKDGDILYIGGHFRQEIIYPDTDKRFGFIKRNMNGVIDIGYIEDQEINIIYSLENWIKGCLARWHNPDYALANNLYTACVVGVLMVNMPKMILNFRLNNCLTPNAHSFHIREFLNSHGYIGKYIDDLPLQQTLFLYRNIRYIEKHIGLQDTFDLLVNKLATPAGIPLTRYYIGHDTTDFLNNENLVPKCVLEHEVINFRQLATSRDFTLLEDMIEKQSLLAKDNPKDAEEIKIAAIETNRIGLSSSGNRYPTKIVESSMLDFSDRVAFPLSNVLLNMWLYTASRGGYTGTVYITHPLSGHRFFLSPKNAYILFIYCLNKGYLDVELETIPELPARCIPKTPFFTPTLAQLRQSVQEKFVSDDELLQLIGSTPTPSYVYNSPDVFYQNAVLVQKELMRRYHVVCGRHSVENQLNGQVTGSEGPVGRAHLMDAMSRLYWQDQLCSLSALTYQQWIAESGVDLIGMSRQNYINLAFEIAKKATGIPTNQNAKLRDLQKAVMEIMKQFSSYAIQYVYSINDSAIMTSDIKSLRFKLSFVTGSGLIYQNLKPFSVNAITSSGNSMLTIRRGSPRYRVSDAIPL